MKKWILHLNNFMAIGFMFAFLSYSVSCTQSSKKQDDHQPMQNPFSGYWVDENYYDKLIATHSPRASQDESRCIYIPDSLHQSTQMIFNFHEGGEDLFLKESNNSYTFWTMDADGQEQIKDSLVPISSERIRIGKIFFRRVDAFFSPGNYFIPEALLFGGTYAAQDGQTIQFKNDRHIKAWELASYYEVQSDYFDAGLQVDQIALGTSESDKQWYAFRFSGDSLLIYELKCLTPMEHSEACQEVGFGNLKFALKKIKATQN